MDLVCSAVTIYIQFATLIADFIIIFLHGIPTSRTGWEVKY